MRIEREGVAVSLEGGYFIDIDQEAIVLLPLYFGNVGMRPSTQLRERSALLTVRP